MKRIDDNTAPVDRAADRRLWQRCRLTEIPEDEAERFLDLAAFADGLLDVDERERVVAMLAAGPDGRADIAAARALASGVEMPPTQVEPVIARACALFPENAPDRKSIAVAALSLHRPILHGLAHWGSLAAAIVMAGWLGFSMGSDAWSALNEQGQPSGDNFAVEMFDTGASFLSDLGEGRRT